MVTVRHSGTWQACWLFALFKVYVLPADPIDLKAHFDRGHAIKLSDTMIIAAALDISHERIDTGISALTNRTVTARRARSLQE